MDAITSTILILGSIGSLGLLAYAHHFLPRMSRDRLKQSLRAFSTAIELRFPHQKGSTDQISQLAERVGKKVGVTPSQRDSLELASLLRDIGLCGIPYEMLNEKSELEWEDNERMTFNQHAEIGASMLEGTPSLATLAPLVRHHHARYDGVGSGGVHPAGIGIPVESRILKVVSEYVWEERRGGKSKARELLRTESGKAFDPQVVMALVDVLTSAGGWRILAAGRK